MKTRQERPYAYPTRTAKLIILICILSLIAPLAVLVAFSDDLSRPLALNGCLPDGGFAIPGTASVWDVSHTLSIDIPVTSELFLWNFANIKSLDVACDLLVGRGIQILLGFTVFHIFSNVVLRLMESEEIPFRTYHAVSWEYDRLSLLPPLIAAMRSCRRQKSQVGQEQGSYRSWKARLVMLTMALLTIYIATFPTLFSAMTGYYSPGRLMIMYHRSSEDIEAVDCRGVQMMPAWGVLLDGERVGLDNPTAFSYPYPEVHSMREYYSIYQSAYNAAECMNAEDTADCTATNISSQYICPRNVTYHLDPPLLNFHLLSNDSVSIPLLSPDKMPVAWVCDFALFYHADFFAHSGSKEPNATGLCQSDSHGYIWGFSYILLFIMCLLNLISAVALYGLWIYGHGKKEGTLRAREPASQLRAAANIIHQAREYYGAEAVNGDWDCKRMERDIFGGEKGMRMYVYCENHAL